MRGSLKVAWETHRRGTTSGCKEHHEQTWQLEQLRVHTGSPNALVSLGWKAKERTTSLLFTFLYILSPLLLCLKPFNEPP